MARGVTFENCRGEKLAGVLHVPDRGPSRAGVVLCHGMESSKSSAKIATMTEFLRDRGLTALRFDFAGSGESAGDFAEISYSHQVDDLRAAVTCLLDVGVTRIGLIGSSMGGSVALLYAGTAESTAGVVTIAAPSDPLEIVEQLVPCEERKAWEERGFADYHGRRINRTFLDDVRELDILGAATRISCPVLVIHGDADETVPVNQAYRLYEALETEKKMLILPGADHRLSAPEDMTRAISAAQQWIVRFVRDI